MRQDYSLLRRYINPSSESRVKGTIRVEETPPSEYQTQYVIYLPPSYSSDKNHSVLYHLHFYGGTLPWIQKEVSWTAATMEQFSEEGMIIVAPIDPTRSSMFADGKSIKMTTKIMEHVLPHIEKTYSVHADRFHRFIQGFSMGGFGAALLSFKYPETFGKCVIWDGALHNWETMSTNRKQIAESQFDNKQELFEPSSPWLAVTKVKEARDTSAGAAVVGRKQGEDGEEEEATSIETQIQTTPVFIVTGAMEFTSDSGERFVKHLKENDVKVTHVDTDLPHCLKDYLDGYGKQAVEFLNNSK